MEALKTYIKSKPSKTMAEWANDLGVSRPFLYGLLDGNRQPSIKVAKRINAATDGMVPITAWPNIRAVLDAAKDDAA